VVLGSRSPGERFFCFEQPDRGGFALAVTWLYFMCWSSYGIEIVATFAPEYHDTERDTAKALRGAALFSGVVYALSNRADDSDNPTPAASSAGAPSGGTSASPSTGSTAGNSNPSASAPAKKNKIR